MIPLDSLPDAVIVADSQGHIVRVNAHAEELFGYTRAEMIGQPLELLVPQRFHKDHVQHRNAYLSARRVRPMGKGLLTALRKDGKEVPVDIMLSPDPDGTVLAVVRDASQRRQLEQFRDEYLGYISHDLKNPLSVITLQARLLAQQLADRGLKAEEHGVSVIAQSAAFIDRLVRELLEMSYLESEQVELRKDTIDLAGFLRATLERTVSTSDSARIALEVRDWVTALVDPDRIERVVVNFVQNAIKYSPADSPIVVRVEEREGMGVVSVVDRGPGLTKEQSSYVFDKYRRTPSAAKRDGLGLGLYIGRKIIEAHDGKIGVDSTPGSGATFFFSVPLAAAPLTKAPVTVAIAPTDSPSSHLRGLKVLVVDDEPNAVSALVALLGEEGLVVTGVTSGEQALAAVEVSAPDVAVVDVEMPGMSGLVLLAALRARIPQLPDVIISGFLAHHAGIAGARETTGAAYIGKPVDVDELIGTLAQMFLTRSSK